MHLHKAFSTAVMAVIAIGASAACKDASAPDGGSPLTHPNGTIAARRDVGDRPYAVAIAPDGRMLVTMLDNAEVLSDVLPATQFSNAMSAGNTPTDVWVDNAGDRGFIANQFDDAIQVFNPKTGQTLSTVPVLGDPFSVVSDASGATIYVTTNRNALYKIGVATPSVSTSLATDNATAQSLAFSPKSGLLYVSTRDGGTVMEVNTDAMSVVRRFAPGGRTQEVAVTADGTQLWVANETGFVTVVDLGTGATSTIATGGMPWGLAITPDQKQVWVGSLSGGSVYVIDRASKAVVNSIGVGGIPRRIRFSPRGDEAIVANEAGFISVIN